METIISRFYHTIQMIATHSIIHLVRCCHGQMSLIAASYLLSSSMSKPWVWSGSMFIPLLQKDKVKVSRKGRTLNFLFWDYHGVIPTDYFSNEQTIPGIYFNKDLQPAAHLRPSGKFCAAREGYFTKYNALWILKLESLDTIWLKENKFTARSKILNNYPKL